MSIRFQSRGPFKCVKRDGRSQRGVHNALNRCLNPNYDYATCLADGTLTRSSLPPSDCFISDNARVVRPHHPAGAARMGCLLDSQLTSSIKLHASGVPTRAFSDSTFRNHFIKCKYGIPKHKDATKLRNACKRMMPETILAWRVFLRMGLDPLSTQDAVASGGVGTRVDVVACDADGNTRILEIKRGCATAYGNGRRMRAPYQSRLISTHDHYILQTLVTHKLYKACHPHKKMGSPLLLRFDKEGANVYSPPSWAVDGLAQLMVQLYNPTR